MGRKLALELEGKGDMEEERISGSLGICQSRTYTGTTRTGAVALPSESRPSPVKVPAYLQHLDSFPLRLNTHPYNRPPHVTLIIRARERESLPRTTRIAAWPIYSMRRFLPPWRWV